jgi:hypothetical protein
MNDELPFIPVQRRTGGEGLHVAGQSVGPTLLDFWRWAGSDLLGNTFRGWLAEFIVASDVGVADGVRRDWEGFDLEMKDGTRVEVKASAYLQSWKQKRLSKPTFSIRRAKAWDPRTDTYTETASRHSDVYIFCLLHHCDKATVDPLDVSQWTFYVVPTGVLDSRFGSKQSVTLEELQTLGARAVHYGDIGNAVRVALREQAERV